MENLIPLNTKLINIGTYDLLMNDNKISAEEKKAKIDQSICFVVRADILSTALSDNYVIARERLFNFYMLATSIENIVLYNEEAFYKELIHIKGMEFPLKLYSKYSKEFHKITGTDSSSMSKEDIVSALLTLFTTKYG